MCDKCRDYALAMVAMAGAGSDSKTGVVIAPDYRVPTAVIQKVKFKLWRLPTQMTFSHATGVSPQKCEAAGGLDPSFSSEICYSADTGPHEMWFDRMLFAAVKVEGRIKSKVAQEQGYGPYIYEFEAPAGTMVRSTNGGSSGEVCFPDFVPWSAITAVYLEQATLMDPAKAQGEMVLDPRWPEKGLTKNAPVGKSSFIVQYVRP